MDISEELSLMAQLVLFQEEAVRKLEEFHDKKDIDNFKRVKSELIKFQKQLSELLLK